MIHFDAHSDTNDRYFGDNRYTHGTPFRRAVEEGLLDPKRVVQIGIRGSIYESERSRFRDEQRLSHRLHGRIRRAQARGDHGRGTRDRRRKSRLMFHSMSTPSIRRWRPGTGTPEIGGITTFEAMRMLRCLRGLPIIGADVVEVAPPFDVSGTTALVGATMMFELLCLMAEVIASGRAVV